MLKKMFLIASVTMGLSATSSTIAKGLDCWCHGNTAEGTCQDYKCACAAPNGKCGSASTASGALNLGSAKIIKSVPVKQNSSVEKSKN
jgi:hypothetical protein